MKRTLGTWTALAVTATVLAASAHGAEAPTRESFVAQAEPICAQNTVLVKKALAGAREKVANSRLRPAGRQFIHASEVFGKGIRQLVALPRPPADDERLLKWFSFLRIVKGRLADIGKALKEEKRIKAEHESIRAERSANAANNVSFVFGFRSCRLSRSQFR